jgi:hypothetical protein
MIGNPTLEAIWSKVIATRLRRSSITPALTYYTRDERVGKEGRRGKGNSYSRSMMPHAKL